MSVEYNTHVEYNTKKYAGIIRRIIIWLKSIK